MARIEARRHRDEAPALAGPGGERIDLTGFVDADLRHRQVCLSSEPFDGLIQPIELWVTGSAVDQMNASGALRDPSRYLQRDERAAHAPDQAEHRERAEIRSSRDAEHRDDDRQRQDDRKIGKEKQKNPFTHDVREYHLAH
jgi:hypothetical protein